MNWYTRLKEWWNTPPPPEPPGTLRNLRYNLRIRLPGGERAGHPVRFTESQLRDLIAALDAVIDQPKEKVQ